jgi:predicted Rossmann-fold nucleotide-binding protein
MGTKMRLAIVGSRDYSDYVLFSERVNEYVAKNGMPEMIVSGGAVGVDTMAEKWADEHGIPTLVHLPKYDKSATDAENRQAPLRRNTLIINDATAVLAFVTAGSRGTWDSIRKAQAKKLPCTILLMSSSSSPQP